MSHSPYGTHVYQVVGEAGQIHGTFRHQEDAQLYLDNVVKGMAEVQEELVFDRFESWMMLGEGESLEKNCR